MLRITLVWLMTFVLFFFGQQARAEDYLYYDNVDMYYKFHKEPLPWYEAKLKCAHEDGVLAMPRDVYEAETIKRIFAQYPKESLHGLRHPDFVLIGFHDHFEENEFVGIDGVPLQYFYHKWNTNQPDNFKDEDCGSMHRNGKLNDFHCGDSSVFICQKDGNTLKTYFSNEKCQTNDPAYVYFEEAEKCYKLHTSPRRWSDARVICEIEGGHMAVITNSHEEQFLARMFNAPENKVNYIESKDYALLGYHDLFKEGHFTTVTDVDLSELGYVNWAPGQPDNFQHGEHCGAMTKTGQLNDIRCSTQGVFICEQPSNPFDSRFGPAKKNK